MSTNTSNSLSAEELWQLYDDHGMAIIGKGATKDAVFSRGLLHGASHIWVWRTRDNHLELLVQKRASSKQTWPDLYDISAAGHIDLGESPLEAALRESKEEINLEPTQTELKLFAVHRTRLTTEKGAIENEFQWLYSLELPSETEFTLQDTEVASLLWIPMEEFKESCTGEQYVPHGKLYYDIVIESIESEANARL